MFFMSIVTGCEDVVACGQPLASLFVAFEHHLEEAAKSGKMVSFGGLHPTSSGTRMRLTNGKIVATDGPFSESKEVIGGFSILKVASKEEAIAEAHKFMELHRIHWPTWQGQVEIRLMYEQEDDVQAAQIEGSRLIERGHIV
jgi:hypothetical protein